MSKYKFTEGKLIVFEGLDATGKSTQINMFTDEYYQANLPSNPDSYANSEVHHQPSSAKGLGHQIYALTEAASKGAQAGGEQLDPVAQQYLHLAAHAEHYAKQINPALSSGKSILLDRNWWSTVAYGWYDGKLGDRIDLVDFINMAQLPASGTDADVTFLFNAPYQEDPHNTIELQTGYSWLAARFNNTLSPVIHVPVGSIEEVHNWLVAEMIKLKLLEEIVEGS